MGTFQNREPKQTISTNGKLELFQIVSEPGTKRCVIEDADPQMVCTVRSHIS